MRHLQIAALVGTLSIAATGAIAQPRPQTPATPQAPATPARPQAPAPPQSSPLPFQMEQANANETRERLNEIFRQYPPSVREVLRIDPTLMYRQDYMANYPMLAAFLDQHPQIAHNPGFFLGEWRYQEQNNDPRMEAMRVMRHTAEFGAIALIVATITTGVIFLVRTVVEHWRWQRALKAQNELNAKLIDRFSTSEALLAYLQSPQGKALTEGPVMSQPGVTRMMDAPLNRIFWSLQAGAVVACAGVGLLMASRAAASEVGSEAASFFTAFGTVILAVGAGFLLSSVAAFFLSNRLGLVKPLSSRYSGETPGS